jgi:L,D-peptidoglycan transpeptidase YkuD (ErfK/YbiS/YcfS/YnhG family)
VRAKPGHRSRGWLLAGPLALPVALGRGGIKANKREGDGGTPRGTFRLRRLWWRADRLQRKDRLYDFIIELDHNTRPRIAGRGSAVFVHVARPGFAPTAGCVALTPSTLRRLIARIGPRTRISIG